MSFLCAREVFRKVKRKSVEEVGPLDQDHKGLAAVGLGDSMVFFIKRFHCATLNLHDCAF